MSSQLSISKHQQLFRHSPESGIYGDCFRTVIACLLNKMPTEVPHFCDGPDDGKTDQRVSQYLGRLGLKLVRVCFAGLSLEQALATGEAYALGMHWLLTGTSRNGTNHVVICHGAEIVHDTSIDQSGIVGPASDDFWWVEILVKPGVPADAVGGLA